jgi:NitT/TauT family transport system ATP-binding protein
VLQGIGFSLGHHDSLAIVGPSGCGKTTLLLMLAGLVPATAGTVLLDGLPVTAPSREIALVLQEYGLFPWKTVRENILIGAALQGIRPDPGEVAALSEELGIGGLERRYPRQLSGGQRQRVALARALLLRPRLLLLDEPFAALDAITRERLQNHLLRVVRERAISFVIVTHSIAEAVFLGRRIMVLETATGGIGTVLANAEAGGEGYRENPLSFQRETTLRRIMAGAE